MGNLIKHKIRFRAFTALLILSLNFFGQQVNNLQQQIDSLKYLGANAFDCNSVFWKIVAAGKTSINQLVEKLDDTATTQAIHNCKKMPLLVGDLAYLAIEEIAPLPNMLVTGIQFDVIENGCTVGFFDYIQANRAKFKQQVQTYFIQYGKKLKFIQFASNYVTPCRIQNGIKGYYYLK